MSCCQTEELICYQVYVLTDGMAKVLPTHSLMGWWRISTGPCLLSIISRWDVIGLYTCSSYSLPPGLNLTYPQESLYLLYDRDIRLLTEMALETISSSYVRDVNYCQELKNVELIAWKTACILVEHVEKHQKVNTRRSIVVLVVLVFIIGNLHSITLVVKTKFLY